MSYVWGPIDFSYVLSDPSRELETSISPAKKKAKMFYCMDGWVDGWMGGDSFPLSIFFIFKYKNKLFTLLPKICLKVVFA